MNYLEDTKKPLDIASQIERHRGALTVEELSAIVSLSRKQLYKLIKKGAIPSNRVASSVRLDPVCTANWWRSTAA